jgi:hypothetical protein
MQKIVIPNNADVEFRKRNGLARSTHGEKGRIARSASHLQNLTFHGYSRRRNDDTEKNENGCSEGNCIKETNL